VDAAVGNFANGPHQDDGEGEQEEEVGVPGTTAHAPAPFYPPDPLRPDAHKAAGEAGNAVKVASDGRLPAVNHSCDELKWILSMGPAAT